MTKYGQKPLPVDDLSKLLDDDGCALVDIVNDKGQLILPKGKKPNERVKKMHPHIMGHEHEKEIDFSKFRLQGKGGLAQEEEKPRLSRISEEELKERLVEAANLRAAAWSPQVFSTGLSAIYTTLVN